VRKCRVFSANKQFILIFSILASKSKKFAYRLSCSENEMHLIINAIDALQPSQNKFLKYYIAIFWRMYDASWTVYYPDQQMHNKYICIYIYVYIYQQYFI